MHILKQILLCLTLLSVIMTLPGCATTPGVQNKPLTDHGILQENHSPPVEPNKSHTATYLGIGVGTALGILGIAVLGAIVLHSFVFAIAAAPVA